MSSAELVEAMQGYNLEGDNTGLAAFLDDCVASGRLTNEQADQYYEKYMKVSKKPKVPTTVKPHTYERDNGRQVDMVN
jgi:DNA-binding transcriptional regulator YbjK